MRKIRLGKTELMVTKTAMGCLPVQRCDVETAVKILRAAYDGGITFFDTANKYSDSEMKIGLALSDVRENIVISTKSAERTRQGVLDQIQNSLKMMKTDYIDLFQFHQVEEKLDYDDPDGCYAGALEAKERGWIHHIGITTHRINIAEDAIESGRFETLQFPFSYISTERDLALAQKCKEADMGFLAMKGLAGGLLNNAEVCQKFMDQYDNVVPLWGIQRMEELQQWIALANEEPAMDEEAAAFISKEREELAATFCRGCGYCCPCPAGIEIFNLARLNMLLRRSPWKQYYTPGFRAKVEKINDCMECYSCASKCPYQLDTPKLLKYMLKDYNEFYEAHKNEL